jgi:hypothetical protein
MGHLLSVDTLSWLRFYQTTKNLQRPDPTIGATAVVADQEPPYLDLLPPALKRSM